MKNADVARQLDEVADLLEIQGANPFRVRAYRNAARAVLAHGEPIEAVAARGAEALCELPGVGKDLAGKIREALDGRVALLDELAAEVPESVALLLHVRGVGPKRARQVFERLGVRTVEDLAVAARAGRLRELRGFGEKLEARILEGCGVAQARGGRVLLTEADAAAATLLGALKGCPGVEAATVAGSLRRRRETIGDIDLLVASRDPAAVGARLVAHPDVREVIAEGPSRCAVVLRSGLQVDLRIVPPRSYGAALHYFTGSKAHNIAVRTLGLKRGLKINEYGVFRGGRRVGGRTEAEVFRAVGLPWIAPELREDRGELDAAREHRLPRLVEVADLRGDLHVHTTASDGQDHLDDLVAACRRRGYAYVAITDHTPALRMIQGLDRRGLRRQALEIAGLRARDGIAVLRGAEVDIRSDGSLDLDDATLASLDLVVAAVHVGLDQPGPALTECVLRALRHPAVHVLAHPSGRLLGKREPSALDLAQIVRAAADLGVLLEIDAQPDRLDLDDVHARMARDLGARLVVSSDAHRVAELDFVRFGVDQARRGWCTREDIANTWPLAKLLRWLGRRAARAAS